MSRTKFSLSFSAMIVLTAFTASITYAVEDANILNDKDKYGYKGEISDVSQLPDNHQNLALLKTLKENSETPKRRLHQPNVNVDPFEDPRDNLPTLENVLEKTINPTRHKWELN